MNEKKEVYGDRCEVNRLIRVNITLSLWDTTYLGFKEATQA